ncbi:hypothetical protein N0V95_006933 [Ascochyta clinopodiicola]|nr:hypothetical protein N0V95_006933 [Ascochyta clinopodiicola]
MTNGLRLISEWQQQRKIDAPLQGSACTTGPTGLIEEILLPMFQRGITSAQLYGVKTEDHLDIPFPDPDRFLKLPFSLEEAERSSRELRNASVLFLRQVGFKHMGKIPLDVADTVQQAQLLECHRVWFERVQIAEDTLRWSKNDRVSLSALKVALYATTTYIGCVTTVLQVPFDKYLHTFKALIRNAEIVLDAMDLNKTHSAKFTFEASIIPPLNHTATRCRCPSTRRKAISLLERGPPREGLWDAEQHVLVTRRVVELEEAELDPETGWPVERTRIYSSVTDGNMDVNGGFWVYFIPSAWVGEVDATGKQRQWQERFHM